mgnify:CR=1 FL=1
MAVRVRAVRKNHNPTLYIIELSPILESTKGIEIKLGAYIDVNERKYRREEP